MPRGRPPTLKDRKTTSVSLESCQAEYVLKKGIDLSKFVRDNIDALMQSDETEEEQLIREIEELEQEIQDREILRRQKEIKLRELQESRKKETEQRNILEMFEAEKRQIVVDSKKMMNLLPTCTRDWLEYMSDTCKFASFDEAKSYIRNVWIEDGVPEKRANTFLKIN
jgi:TolA-binding protein